MAFYSISLNIELSSVNLSSIYYSTKVGTLTLISESIACSSIYFLRASVISNSNEAPNYRYNKGQIIVIGSKISDGNSAVPMQDKTSSVSFFHKFSFTSKETPSIN